MPYSSWFLFAFKYVRTTSGMQTFRVRHGDGEYPARQERASCVPVCGSVSAGWLPVLLLNTENSKEQLQRAFQRSACICPQGIAMVGVCPTAGGAGGKVALLPSAGHLIAKEPAIFCAFDRNRTWEEIVPTASLC